MQRWFWTTVVLMGSTSSAVQLCGEVHEEGFVDAVALGAVGSEVAAAFDVLVGHADGGGEAAEEKAAGLEHAPEALRAWR